MAACQNAVLHGVVHVHDEDRSHTWLHEPKPGLKKIHTLYHTLITALCCATIATIFHNLHSLREQCLLTRFHPPMTLCCSVTNLPNLMDVTIPVHLIHYPNLAFNPWMRTALVISARFCDLAPKTAVISTFISICENLFWTNQLTNWTNCLTPHHAYQCGIINAEKVLKQAMQAYMVHIHDSHNANSCLGAYLPESWLKRL